MGEPFLGELKIVSFQNAPNGWAQCNGQFLPINQNQALFSLLGTMYGGNGQTTFALPDLRGCIPIHVGQGHTQGEKAGSDAVTISASTMPSHTHSAQGSTSVPNQPLPTGNYWAGGGPQTYGTPANLVAMAPQAVTSVGGSQAHENRPPFLALTFIIALIGLFPSQA